MKRQCVWCNPPHDMGQTPPFENTATTSSMCDEAAKREHAKVDALFGTSAETQTSIPQPSGENP